MVQSRQGRVRKIIVSSEDEDETASNHAQSKRKVAQPVASSLSKNPLNKEIMKTQVPLPTRTRRKPLPRLPSSQTSTASPTPTPNASPEKTKDKTSKKGVPKSGNPKTLYSFFNAATEKLQQNSQPAGSAKIEEKEDLDTIEDDFSVPDLPRKTEAQQPSVGLTTHGKRSLQASTYSASAMSTGAIAPSSKYRKNLDGKRVSPEILASQHSVAEDTRPWAEKYGPTTLDDLVVHKNKTAAVQQWLTAALAGHPYKSLLILKGPAGSGKTAALEMLSKSIKFEIIEWKNPTMSDFSAEDYVSASAQFEDFLLRGRHFNSLDMVRADVFPEDTEVVIERSAIPDAGQPQVVLVEDFPYAVLRMGPAAQSLRASLLQCLAARPIPGQPPSPIVLIITESILSNNTTSQDSFTAHRLLGPDILHHPGTVMIEFNPVAPTFITKALNLVVQKHRRSNGIVLTPDSDVVRSIAQIGDVRNAVATLEFLSARDELHQPNPPSLGTKAKSRCTNAKSTLKHSSKLPATTTNLSLVSLRESSIGLFHAVGKVVYNKRSTPTDTITNGAADHVSDGGDPLPSHLAHHTRPLPSEVSISTLIDETGTDTSTFLSALHENYVLSCGSPLGNSEATLDAINSCLDILSDSALLHGPVSSSYLNRSGISEGVRQDEIAFDTCVRGILHALPHPVKRQAHPGKAGGKSAGLADAHRMFYPTDLKIWRKREEVLGLLDVLVVRAMDGSLLAGMPLEHRNHESGAPLSVSQPGRVAPPSMSQRFRSGVESWRKSAAHRAADPGSDSPDESISCIGLGSGHSARQEMLLERLPYLAHILLNDTRSASTFGSGLTRQIHDITSFAGIGVLQDEEEYGDAAAGVGTAEAIVHMSASSNGAPWVHKTAASGEDELDVRGLVLSDDDIEDD